MFETTQFSLLGQKGMENGEVVRVKSGIPTETRNSCSLCLPFFLGRYIRTNLNMPHSLPQRSGGFRDYEKDAPITVFGCMQARLVGKSLGVIAQPFPAMSSECCFQ